MYSYTTICWLLSRVYVLVVGLNVLATTYPTFFYSWKGSNRRYQIRFPELPRSFNPPTRISYKLQWDYLQCSLLHSGPQGVIRLFTVDAWSQYDNPEEGSAQEGDIRERSGSRKTMTTDKNLLWPGGVVPYCIEDSLVNEPEKLAILEGAMAKIMESTCLKFIRIYPEPDREYPFFAWVNITGKDVGCYSDLGRSSRSPSILNLDVDRCFRTNGHALHEILHTLGAFHEHMRPDRDEYIQVLWNNIRDGDEFNFRIMDENVATTYGLPYDYDSIMHYSMTAFSKDRSIPTIIPRKQGVTIGQREYLSFYDIQKLLITYKCNEVDSKYGYRRANEERGDYVEWGHSNTTETVRRASHATLEMPRNNLYDHKRIYAWQPWTLFYHLKYPSYPDDDYYH